MDFVSYASSSKGNLYTVSDGQTTIMLEMGLSISDIQASLDYGLSSIDGALLTHEHQDHARGIKGVIRHGVDVFATKGTIQALNLETSYRLNAIDFRKPFNIGTLKIQALEVHHDAIQPACFLILSEMTGESLLFATDLAFLPYAFNNLNYLCIEANYCENRLVGMPRTWKERLLDTHMSIQGLEKALESTHTGTLKEVHLMHLSEQHSAASEFKQKIRAITGAPVYICDERS